MGLQSEEWKDIPGFDGRYQASNLGRIRRCGRTIDHTLGYKFHLKEKLLSLHKSPTGYLRVPLIGLDGVRHTYQVHRLVAMTFIPNIDNLPQINHLNKIKDDNRLENLEWCTASYNVNWGTRNSNLAKRYGRPVIGINLNDGTEIYFPSISEAKRQGHVPTNISKGGVTRIVGCYRGDMWAWRWADDTDYQLPELKDVRKGVYGKFILDDSVISFVSLREANRNGFSRNSIKQSIKKQRPYKGYLWQIK